ncbi:MAG: TonB-dependent receptor family protein [Burkholderiales bacterium]
MVAAVYLAGACAPASGEDAVTVTATRVERPSLDVPASIDRVHAGDIRFARPGVNMSEPLARVPGLVVQNRNNYAQDLQVSVRGFGARATFGVRGLRLVADGIPASMPDGQGQVAHFDLASAERIEVLRGPFSVLHGNASGGVINLLTESGAREPGIAGDLMLGSFGSWRAGFKASGATAAADGIVSASRYRSEGFRRHSSVTREQMNAKLRFSLSDATKVSIVANSLAAPETQDPAGLTRAQADADPRQVAAVVDTFNTRKTSAQLQLGATLEHRFGDHTLAATVFGGQRDVRQYLGFNGGATATAAGGVVDLDRDFGGASLRLSSKATLLGRPLSFAIGGEVERMAERRQGFVNDNGHVGAPRRDQDDAVTSAGAYAQAEWRPGERWIALAGLRASQVDFRSQDYYIAAGNPDDSGRRRYARSTPALGLAYRFAPGGSVYLNYGHGFETPTFAELAYRTGGSGLNFALAASRSRHAELGVKTLWPGGARLNAALFHVGTQDEIVVASNAGGRSTFKNAGRTERKGMELLAEVPLPAGFEAAFAWTLLDARFRDAFTAGGVAVAAGNVLPGVPRMQAWAELKWRHAPAGFTAALDLQHRSRVAVDDRNSEYAPAYTVAGLGAELVQHAGNWRFTEYLRIDNLADRRIIGSVIVNEANGRYYEPAPGRNWVLGVRAKLLF